MSRDSETVHVKQQKGDRAEGMAQGPIITLVSLVEFACEHTTRQMRHTRLTCQ